jgi:nucleoside-diphosphate-sugar epimerase
MGSWAHPWSIVHRIRQGKKIIVPGDGTSLWVLTWNADFARGLLGLLGNVDAIGEAYHITSDEVLTWNQIYVELFEALGVEPNILHVPTDLIEVYWPHAHGSLLGDKANSVVFDNTKIKRTVPGFRCVVKWADGVRKAIAWHEAHPEFQTVDSDMDRILDHIVAAMEQVPLKP